MLKRRLMFSLSHLKIDVAFKIIIIGVRVML
jgi:hypothetical protein